MANQQQNTVPVLCSVESSLPDMVALDSPGLPHEAIEMDASSGRLSAPRRKVIEMAFSIRPLFLFLSKHYANLSFP